MAVPDFQTMMLPALSATALGPRTVSELSAAFADSVDLSPEDRAETINSGRQTLLMNRMSWAVIYMTRAGLLRRPQRGLYEITDAGRAVLANPPPRINRAFLQRYPEFQEFMSRSKKKLDDGQETDTRPVLDSTPDETIRIAHNQITEALASELLERLHAAPPAFFEGVVTDLLSRMGYGEDEDTAHTIGKSGDDGVDGVVNLDPLGVDQVYFQAKRYAPGSPVGSGAIRDFFGALAMQDVTKGIFVTTSHFTASARDTAAKLSKRIVLIDGAELARLMIRHSVGCRVVEAFPVSKIDESFFE